MYGSVFRLTPQQAPSVPATTTLQSSQCQLSGSSPLVMPVFPLRPAHPTATPHHHYSPYSPSRFHIDKRCQHRCSWKCLSIVLILLAVALTAMLAYFAGKHHSSTKKKKKTCDDTNRWGWIIPVIFRNSRRGYYFSGTFPYRKLVDRTGKHSDD